MKNKNEALLSVLNAEGKDDPISYEEGVSAPSNRAHPPVNFHAYAACVSGSFDNDINVVLNTQANVLALLRKRIKHSFHVVETLKSHDKHVFVSWKESGLHQVDAQLQRRDAMRIFKQVLAVCDGVISPTSDLIPLYHSTWPENKPPRIAFIPTPYPLEHDEWNFSVPMSERRGIFIGTREFDVPTRRHFAALGIARELCAQTGCETTVINTDGAKGRRRIKEFEFPQEKLTVLETKLPYPEYLRLIARHRIVLQCDQSAVPGQVAGDALLCRSICVGGNGAVDRIGFPETCGHGREIADLRDVAGELLRNEQSYRTALEHSQAIAMKRLSFTAVARELRNFIAS